MEADDAFSLRMHPQKPFGPNSPYDCRPSTCERDAHEPICRPGMTSPEGYTGLRQSCFGGAPVTRRGFWIGEIPVPHWTATDDRVARGKYMDPAAADLSLPLHPSLRSTWHLSLPPRTANAPDDLAALVISSKLDTLHPVLGELDSLDLCPIVVKTVQGAIVELGRQSRGWAMVVCDLQDAERTQQAVHRLQLLRSAAPRVPLVVVLPQGAVLEEWSEAIDNAGLVITRPLHNATCQIVLEQALGVRE